MQYELEAKTPHTVEPRPWVESLGGLVQGYSVYTTFKLPLPERWLQVHLARLAHDAEAMGMQWADSYAGLLVFLKQFTPPPGQPVVRLTLFADVQGYADFYRSSEPIPARLLMTTRAMPEKPARPLSLQAVHFPKAMPTIKLSAIPEIIRLKQQARQAGWDDIVLINAQNQVSEASTANIFFIREGALWTPEPERDGCLPGITRQQVLLAADRLGCPVHQETPVALDDLSGFEGAFLTNSVSGIQKVERINQHQFSWAFSADEALAALTSSFAELTRV